MTSKNFQDVIEGKLQKHHHGANLPLLGQLKQQSLFDNARTAAIKIFAPIGLSLITGPLTTISILLQMTHKPLVNLIDVKLKMIDPADPTYKYVKNGIFGDNKIWKPFQFQGYKDVIKQLGKEGLRGMYKGNLTGMIYLGTNAKLRSELYSQTLNLTSGLETQGERDFIKQNLITIATCTLADLVTLPLMFCQSRLIMQNSLSNFRVYKTPFSILKEVSPRNLFTGASLLIARNTVFSISWLQFINDSPAYSFVLSTIISHILTYPFTTIIRNMQVNDTNVPMMHQRKENIRQTVSRLWKSLGIRGFYRGFLGYGLVHSFMSSIMMQQNMRAGYFTIVE